MPPESCAMPALFLPPRRLRRCLLALLVLGLLLQAQAGVLRQLLGAAHSHRPAQAQADGSWLDRLQAWRHDLLAHSSLVGAHGVDHGRAAPHEVGDGHHHHDGVARHHHAPQDASVVASERAGGDGDPLSDGQAGSLLQPLALATDWGRIGLWRAPATWPGARASRWQDAALRLPERPPRA
jgi:hypothetical protein